MGIRSKKHRRTEETTLQANKNVHIVFIPMLGLKLPSSPAYKNLTSGVATGFQQCPAS